MLSSYYHDSLKSFLLKSKEEINGIISSNNTFDVRQTQSNSWLTQIGLLQQIIPDTEGQIFFEFSIPRLGKRIDCLLLIKNVVFVLEFKVGEKEFLQHNIDQVWDYALDLKNFHKPSHELIIAPIIIATEAPSIKTEIKFSRIEDGVIIPIKTNSKQLKELINQLLENNWNNINANIKEYHSGSYEPTPTIIEAAVSLFKTHSVDNITRNDASAKNLKETSKAISKTIQYAQANNKKVICFVTGVPGAGKTLVGLNVANKHLKDSKTSSVYLSGNAPLVAVLKEALIRDKVSQEKKSGNKLYKSNAEHSVKAFIQIIHHYRDSYLVDSKAPFDHVAIFDEAQRAWDKEHTSNFMARKKNQKGFNKSEPEFLISTLDRHQDWAVIVCLVGGGQEINKGESGISEWLYALKNQYPNWEINISPNLTESEYAAENIIKELNRTRKINYNPDLHLSVSMRSFRADKVSHFVKALLDLDIQEAQRHLQAIPKFKIALTRDLNKAKIWLKENARGSERYGIVASSQAQRLKPLAIDVKSPMNPINWFLNGKDDVRSSYYLEDVATEFHVQGLELDWVCVAWDGDLRYSENGWNTFSFVGTKWNNINKLERKRYLINAYRVLLTRARQGMVIVVPEGNEEDSTRRNVFYDETFSYLKELTLKIL